MSSIFIYVSSVNGQSRKSRNVPVKANTLKMIRSMSPLFIRMKDILQFDPNGSEYDCALLQWAHVGPKVKSLS